MHHHRLDLHRQPRPDDRPRRRRRRRLLDRRGAHDHRRQHLPQQPLLGRRRHRLSPRAAGARDRQRRGGEHPEAALDRRDEVFLDGEHPDCGRDVAAEAQVVDLRLVDLDLPPAFSRAVVGVYAKAYDVNLDEAEPNGGAEPPKSPAIVDA